MKEVKPSKKPLAIYYAIVLLVLLVLNLVFVPWLTERQVKEVDYGTFMSMTAEKQIGKVDIQSNQIIFTDKDEKQVFGSRRAAISQVAVSMRTFLECYRKANMQSSKKTAMKYRLSLK